MLKPSLARLASYNLLRKSFRLKRKRCHYRPKPVHEYKFSSKGISKRSVKAPMTSFRQVLKMHKAQSARNRGFRVRHNHIYTYTQERRGFSYFYCKRKVMDDGIHTEPLDITLCPVPPKEIDDQVIIDMLSTNFEDLNICARTHHIHCENVSLSRMYVHFGKRGDM